MLSLPVAFGWSEPPSASSDWPTFGGTAGRNFVNLRERGLPKTWNNDQRLRHNILWVAKLGTRAYGGPTVSGGKIFVGTNNSSPRNPRDTRRRKDGKMEPIDKSIVMCFD